MLKNAMLVDRKKRVILLAMERKGKLLFTQTKNLVISNIYSNFQSKIYLTTRHMLCIISVAFTGGCPVASHDRCFNFLPRFHIL